MADEKNLDEEESLGKEDKKAAKKAERERRKAEKKAKREAKKAAEENEDDEQEEKLGSKLVLALVTILIIAIWLAIIAVLIKSDVGGFGSSVLYPVLKDVPYVNRILPSQDVEYEDTEDTQYRYGSLDEAVARIKELEQELDAANTKNKKNADTIDDLKAQIEDLSVYKEEEAAFEKEKEKFYEEVVFSDEAPDIEEYKAYYESIDAKNAEVLYKQVVEQITYDEDVQDYVKTYSQMQAKDAAAIFDTMTDNLGLVADILTNMGATSRADILSKMNEETAAKLTEIMEPTK
jgi:flagellar motility protein MotE (MotC chaperone)